jgi:hypothetical protein
MPLAPGTRNVSHKGQTSRNGNLWCHASPNIGIKAADWSYVAEGPQPEMTAEPMVGLPQ